VTWPLRDDYARRLPDLGLGWTPQDVPAPVLVALNEALAAELGLDAEWLRAPEQVAVLAGAAVPDGATPVAQAYAGHQFGVFAGVLGDGRAVLLGELVDGSGRLRDLSLKGSGRTAFSRGGDGKAVLGPVLREFVVSEGMHALGIPTTRALAAVETGEKVWREGMQRGAVLARVAASHLRVGTFELAARQGDPDRLRALADLAIERHHPDAATDERPYLALLRAVVRAQAALLADWMAVGFIHGVMNTDNTTISGETIDYGPCAFVETFDENAVFSSIDHGGRYRFGQQPGIAVWNLSRLAECLLPLIGDEPDEAVEAATEAVEGFVPAFRDDLLARHRRKLGLEDARHGDQALVDDFLRLLKEGRVDHTLGWRSLSASLVADRRAEEILGAATSFAPWRERWVERLGAFDPHQVAARMDAVNPVHVPRNHLVEEVIEAANADDLEPLGALLDAVRAPFGPWVAGDHFAEPAPADFTRSYVTYCGT
jgi:uncharacterized protein YdiU (UPF0061 family)